ncbi:MAG: hypothetical protein ACLPVO_19290 [Desulfomonilaceae bacterium]
MNRRLKIFKTQENDKLEENRREEDKQVEYKWRSIFKDTSVIKQILLEKAKG